MLQEKVNERENEVVEDVEYVDDEFVEAVLEAYASELESDYGPEPEEIMMEAEQEEYELVRADALRRMADTLRSMADELDGLAGGKMRVPADARQPMPFPYAPKPFVLN